MQRGHRIRSREGYAVPKGAPDGSRTPSRPHRSADNAVVPSSSSQTEPTDHVLQNSATAGHRFVICCLVVPRPTSTKLPDLTHFPGLEVVPPDDMQAICRHTRPLAPALRHSTPWRPPVASVAGVSNCPRGRRQRLANLTRDSWNTGPIRQVADWRSNAGQVAPRCLLPRRSDICHGKCGAFERLESHLLREEAVGEG